MAFILTMLKWAVLIAVVYYVFKIARTLVREPNLRLYLVKTSKDLSFL